ncbi:transmembrane protein [Tieghemostelium lacteum]|uniref:Transmembrane protein n=1 Tax=Tieghemostelium lacteum TaxID=361077 RepID=A0A151Z639_TIELA|nr:transmembrane protein [Tieghemostelium lacteum]|eukprot:KYQ89420.1 transmembrane protein [Tieghemostelium lacteum]
MSNEILQVGLNLSKSAVEADNEKNYTAASKLYEQAVLNLKLAIISEKDPNKTSLINSKIDEYSKRNQFIQHLLNQNQQPLRNDTQGSNISFNFPSVPNTVSPSIANLGNTGMNNSGGSIQSFPSFPSVNVQQQQQQPSYMNSNNSSPQDNLAKLASLSTPTVDSSREANQKLNRVEAYEIAKNLSKKGIREEELKNYRGATQYYEQSCAHFLVAIKNEPDPIMKKSMQEEAKVFLDRIEVLKPYVQHQNQTSPPLPQPTPQTQLFNSSVSSISSFPSAGTSMNSFGGMGGINTNMPQQQQIFLQKSQLNNGVGGNGLGQTTNIGMIPTSSFSVDKCAACGAVLSTNSIKALDRNWHPECFSVSIICAGCQKPFQLVNLSLKVKDGKAYHPMCFESTTGLYQEENRSFVGSSKTLFFSIQMQRKFYKAGETIQFAFIIDNATSKKVDKVVSYLLMSENRMEIIGTSYERRSKKSVKKLGRCEFFHSNRFPLVKDRFEGDFFFSLPPNLLPSETSGVDASFVREYQLVVKCYIRIVCLFIDREVIEMFRKNNKVELFFDKTNEKNFEIIKQCPHLYQGDGDFKKDIEAEDGYRKPTVSNNAAVFEPPLSLYATHIMNYYATFMKKKIHLKSKREAIKCPDGGTVSLDWFDFGVEFQPDTPTIVILHGLTGGSHEIYVQYFAKHAFETKGFRSVVLNYRGCAGNEVTADMGYCAIQIDDLKYALEHHIRPKVPKETPQFLIGFSLGSSILVNYLHRVGEENNFLAFASVSNPLDMMACTINLRATYFNRKFYNEALATNLKRLFARFGNRLDKYATAQQIQQAKTIYDLDNLITSKMFNFENADEYYRKASPANHIETLKKPILFINALDDPIAPGHSIPVDKFKLNPNVILATTPSGGHLGFISSVDWENWSDKAVIEYFSTFLPK